MHAVKGLLCVCSAKLPGGTRCLTSHDEMSKEFAFAKKIYSRLILQNDTKETIQGDERQDGARRRGR